MEPKFDSGEPFKVVDEPLDEPINIGFYKPCQNTIDMVRKFRSMILGENTTTNNLQAMKQNERLYEGPRTRRIGSTRRTIEHAVEQLLHCGQTVVMDSSFVRKESTTSNDEIRMLVKKIAKRLFDLCGPTTGLTIDFDIISPLKHNCTAIHIWVIETMNF